MRWIILKVAAVLSIFLIVTSVYPGGFSPGTLGGIFWLPLEGFLLFLPVGVLLHDLARRQERRPTPPRGWLPAAVLLAASLGVAHSKVLLRFAFAACLAAFTSRLESASFEYMPRSGGFQAGPYRIDSYGRDDAGGVYFRTGRADAVIDTISYGFAYRPAGHLTPFGKSDVQVEPLFGEWYVFSVNND
jgi:hypothetical protein